MTEHNVKAVPEGFHRVTPFLSCVNAAHAIEFYKRALGAEELSRLSADDGRVMHTTLGIGDSRIMMAEAFPECGAADPLTLNGSPVTLHLYVDDADRLFDQAVAAGAEVVMPMSDMFWGDRYGQFRDPFGHRWSVATHQRDLTQAEMRQAMGEMTAPGCDQGRPS